MPNNYTINLVKFNVLINLKSFDIVFLKDSFLGFIISLKGGYGMVNYFPATHSAPQQPTFQVKAMCLLGV